MAENKEVNDTQVTGGRVRARGMETRRRRRRERAGRSRARGEGRAAAGSVWTVGVAKVKATEGPDLLLLLIYLSFTFRFLPFLPFQPPLQWASKAEEDDPVALLILSILFSLISYLPLFYLLLRLSLHSLLPPLQKLYC